MPARLHNGIDPNLNPNAGVRLGNPEVLKSLDRRRCVKLQSLRKPEEVAAVSRSPPRQIMI
jgi:hypothetical protein